MADLKVLASLAARDDLEKLIEEAETYDFTRLTWSDLHGIQRAAHVSRHSVASKILNGTGVVHIHIASGPRCEPLPVYPSSAPPSDGNCYMRPVPGTLRPVPWAGDGRHKVCQILCESYWADGRPQQAHPRLVARKQLSRLHDMGYTLKSAWEAEFSLHEENPLKRVTDRPDEYSVIGMKPFETAFLDLSAHMSAVGINVEKFNMEWYPGSFELNLPPVAGIRSPDEMFIFKAACKEIFKEKGMIASFMPVPYDGVASGTMHLNHSLWNSGGNVFYDGGAVGGMSKIARWWTAGLLKHAAALTILLCPTANCYRELHTLMAADKANWGMDNRHAAIRLKSQTPETTYVENRIPSAAANPYIALAATIAAGMDGLQNKLDLPSEMDPSAVSLPHTMGEAIEALEGDKLLMSALGKEFVEWFLAAKKSIELEMFKDHNVKKILAEEIEKEMDMYFVHI